jgi:hypothetical protein
MVIALREMSSAASVPTGPPKIRLIHSITTDFKTDTHDSSAMAPLP